MCAAILFLVISHLELFVCVCVRRICWHFDRPPLDKQLKNFRDHRRNEQEAQVRHSNTEAPQHTCKTRQRDMSLSVHMSIKSSDTLFTCVFRQEGKAFPQTSLGHLDKKPDVESHEELEHQEQIAQHVWGLQRRDEALAPRVMLAHDTAKQEERVQAQHPGSHRDKRQTDTKMRHIAQCRPSNRTLT